MHRTGPYWQWLAGRKAHGELLVAVEGRDDWEDLDAHSHIVGYAVTHGAEVIELCCLPDFVATAAPRLLARACQDAIERDFHTVSLHTPVDDPLHELVVTAGGTWCGNGVSTAEPLLVKLLDAPRWVETMYPVLRKRAQNAGIDRPCELSFDVAGQRLRLMLTRRSGRLVTDETSGDAEVACDRDTFSALLVGNLHVRPGPRRGPHHRRRPSRARAAHRPLPPQPLLAVAVRRAAVLNPVASGRACGQKLPWPRACDLATLGIVHRPRSLFDIVQNLALAHRYPP